MKASLAFIFFLLFLAGIAFVNLRGIQDDAGAAVTAEEQLIDVAWRPTNLREMAIDENSPMRLQFNPGGQMGGHAGCNRYFGQYEFRDNGLVFSMVGATRMACEEPANSIEISYLDVLNQVSNAARVDDRLALRDNEGNTLVRFVAVARE
jgi:heat shock protein HslJ